MIDRWIAQGYDMIAVAPNDPELIAPALRRAKQAGITVLTWDADANPQASERETFVNQAPVDAIGADAGRSAGRGRRRRGQGGDRHRLGHFAQSERLDEGHARSGSPRSIRSSNCWKRWSATKTRPRPIGCRAT